MNKHNVTKIWPGRSEFRTNVKYVPIVNLKNVLLPPLHIKLDRDRRNNKNKNLSLLDGHCHDDLHIVLVSDNKTVGYQKCKGWLTPLQDEQAKREENNFCQPLEYHRGLKDHLGVGILGAIISSGIGD